MKKVFIIKNLLQLLCAFLPLVENGPSSRHLCRMVWMLLLGPFSPKTTPAFASIAISGFRSKNVLDRIIVSLQNKRQLTNQYTFSNYLVITKIFIENKKFFLIYFSKEKNLFYIFLNIFISYLFFLYDIFFMNYLSY